MQPAVYNRPEMPQPQTSSTVWNQELLANPHEAADKQSRVRRMFAAIAGSYDLNNRVHSLWMDQSWRRRAVQLADLKPTDCVLDVACGTGDLALGFARELHRKAKYADTNAPGRVIGLDYTFEMLPIANKKSKISNRISAVSWLNGDAMRLPLPDACVDVVSIAFGIRNVASPQAAISEFHRVLRPGGRLIILEFSLPRNRILRSAYNLYFRRILPITATFISGDRTGAYRYLPESVNTFIDREQMLELLAGAGFTEIAQFPMTFGVCVCYRGLRPFGG